jgi:hypothetical protein
VEEKKRVFYLIYVERNSNCVKLQKTLRVGEVIGVCVERKGLCECKDRKKNNAFNERYACVKKETKRTDRGTDTHTYVNI